MNESIEKVVANRSSTIPAIIRKAGLKENPQRNKPRWNEPG